MKGRKHVHEHIVQMVETERYPSENISPADTSESEQIVPVVEEDDDQTVWLTNTAQYLFENCRRDLGFESMRKIEREILDVENSIDGVPDPYLLLFTIYYLLIP